MKNLLKNKKKLILLSVLLLAVVAGCKTYVDPETKKVFAEYIISTETSWGDTFKEGWFAGIFIWPLAQLINFFGNLTDAGIGIIIATVVINVVIGAMSIKNQVAQQKMQMLQPELNRIQAKYEGKTDDASRMRQAQEMQQLYDKYQINPFSSILGLFIQMPVIMAIYYAVQRAEVVVNGTFLGVDLTRTPLEGIKEMNFVYLVIFVLMVVCQLISMKAPQWIAENKKKKSNVKTKDYAQNKPAGPDQTKMMMYMSTGMIAFIGFTWPTAMSFYWMISSIVRVAQNLIINKFFIKD